MRIETGAKSAVRLRLIDGALLLVSEHTRVSLDELTVFAIPGVTRTRLDVGGGRVETSVTPRADPESRYEIRTPVVTTAVRGTDFRVGMDEAAQTARTEVLSGRVDAQAAGARVGLEAGFALAAAAGAPLAAPQPMLTAPDLSGIPARVDRLPIRASWPAVTGARAYRAQLFATTGDQRLMADDVVSTAEARWPTVDDGSYRVTVRAIDALGLEGRNADARLEVDARPEPPFANVPANASRVYGDRAEFRWTRSDAAVSYDLQVAGDPTFATPLVQVVAQAGVSHAEALPPGTYHWRVASRAASGERGPFGDPQSFTLRRYPEARTASAGLGAAALVLRWSSGAPGETFHFQLAPDREFAAVMVDRTLAESEVTLARPQAGIYFLRVRALDADGMAGPFGPVQQIDVPEPPRPRRSWWWLIPPAAAAAVFLLLS
jgi:hypothetical protein